MKDDKYVEEKARELYNKYAWAVKGSLQGSVHQDCKEFIRTIVEDCKVKVSIKIFDDIDLPYYHTDRKRMFKRKLEEAGMEVEE